MWTFAENVEADASTSDLGLSQPRFPRMPASGKVEFAPFRRARQGSEGLEPALVVAQTRFPAPAPCVCQRSAVLARSWTHLACWVVIDRSSRCSCRERW